jgi:formylglycine-generating enzyme required for sulfatase activity
MQRCSALPVFVGVVIILLISAGGLWYAKRGLSAAKAPARQSQAAAEGVKDAPARAADPAYTRALEAAKAALDRGDFSNAVGQAELALKIKPGDTAAMRVLSGSENAMGAMLLAAERERKFREATNAAALSISQKDYREANRLALAALAVKPNDPLAFKLQADAQQGIQAAADLELNYKSAVVAAQAAYDANDFATALAQAKTALALKPDDTLAAQLRSSADSRLAEAAREKLFQDSLTASQAALDSGDYAKALDQAKSAQTIKPSDETAFRLVSTATAGLAEANRAKQFKDTLAAAQTACESKDFAQALAQAKAALAIKPGDATATQLAATATAGLAEAAQNQKFKDVLAAAQTAYESKDYAKALAQAKAALAIKPADQAAAKLLADATACLTTAPPTLQHSIRPTVCSNHLGMQFVWVPAIKAYLGKFEVTQKQFRDVMGTLPLQSLQQDDLPVANVSFQEAAAFCERLSASEGQGYSLPSEEHWLAAAGLRPSEVAKAWDILKRRGLLEKEVTSWRLKFALFEPAAIGSRGPQTNGLCDLFGNVREWVTSKHGEECAGFSYDTGDSDSRKAALSSGPELKLITGFRCLLRSDQ